MERRHEARLQGHFQPQGRSLSFALFYISNIKFQFKYRTRILNHEAAGLPLPARRDYECRHHGRRRVCADAYRRREELVLSASWGCSGRVDCRSVAAGFSHRGPSAFSAKWQQSRSSRLQCAGKEQCVLQRSRRLTDCIRPKTGKAAVRLNCNYLLLSTINSGFER